MKNYNIITEAPKISALPLGKIGKYEYLISEEILPSDQSRIEQAKFAYTPLGKAFEKQTTKTIEEQGKKQIDAIANQNKGLEALTNKDDHKSIYKEIFDQLVNKNFDEIKELTDEIEHNDLIYYCKNNTTTDFNDFKICIELFRKVKSGQMKLEDVRELQNIFTTNLNYLLDHILFQILKIILKKHGKKPVSPPIKIYISIIENRITFKIKTGYYLELLTPKTMKLLGNTKRKITKDKNGEKVPYLEITEVVLIHFNIVNNSYQENSRVV